MIDLEKFASGEINPRTLTLAEFLEVSVMQMVSRDELHLDIPVHYGGGIYLVHTCVSQVTPPEESKNLTESKH